MITHRPPLRHSALRAPASGFTLVEIILVLVIISLLAGSAIFMLKGNIPFAQEVKIEGDLKAIAPQLQVYQARNYKYPTTEQGLQALVERPAEAPDKWSQLLEEVPLDPWGEPYQYRYPAERSNKEYDIFSLGKDGEEGTEDDAGNW